MRSAHPNNRGLGEGGKGFARGLMGLYIWILSCLALCLLPRLEDAVYGVRLEQLFGSKEFRLSKGAVCQS